MSTIFGVLTHKSNKSKTGAVFQLDKGGNFELIWERAEGALLNPNKVSTTEAVARQWEKIQDFSLSTCPNSAADMGQLLEKAHRLLIGKFNEESIELVGKSSS